MVESDKRWVYVSWYRGCTASERVWRELKTQLKPLSGTRPDGFGCRDRQAWDDLDSGPRPGFDAIMRQTRLVVILVSSRYLADPQWIDEVEDRLLAEHEAGSFVLHWQQIDASAAPPKLQPIKPLLDFEGTLWNDATGLNASVHALARRIETAWDALPAFSLDLATCSGDLPTQPQQPLDPRPLCHYALVVSPTGLRQGAEHAYQYEVYSRAFGSETYEICKTFAPNRGAYPFPWPLRDPALGATAGTPEGTTANMTVNATANTTDRTTENTRANATDPPSEKLPRCAILHHLLAHAQQGPEEFVLEIFAPSRLLDEDWGQLLVPVRGRDVPLAEAHPFLLRPWERLQPDYRSRFPCLRRKHTTLLQGKGQWRDCDGVTSFWKDLRTAHDDDGVVGLRRMRSIPKDAREDWLDAVLGSMVPLAIWPRLAHGADAGDGEASVRLEAFLQRLHLAPTLNDRPCCPDLDGLAWKRWLQAHEEPRTFTLLVDHPHRRPPLPLAAASGSSPPASERSPAAPADPLSSAADSAPPPFLFISP